MKRQRFALQFDPAQIDALAERYNPAQDNDALRAGTKIASGDYSRENLNVIVKWKSPRRAALIDDNKDDEISVALKFASAPTTPERLAIAVLLGLHGVGIPMASAILTAINPERYTITDFRALQSLGVENWPESIEYYVHYLEACREIAADSAKSLRTLDRALWQWSWEQNQRANDEENQPYIGIARKQDHLNMPMPECRRKLPLHRIFNAAEGALILKGFIPDSMDDRWFIFFDPTRSELQMHRSWTGFCIYSLKLQTQGDGYEISEAWVNRDPEQYIGNDIEEDAEIALQLIDVLLLGTKTELPAS